MREYHLRHQLKAERGITMNRNQSTIFTDKQQDSLSQAIAPEMTELVKKVRGAVANAGDWEQAARLVAKELKGHLPPPDVLTAQQRLGDPDHYISYPLHIEPNGNFSIVALVWRPGQETPIHDHVTWCVFGVIQGVEYEELFDHDEKNACLIKTGVSRNTTGTVNQVAPPGDIHRVRNSGNSVAISIHIYGTDVSRIGSSVRRCYNLPVHNVSSARV